MIIFYNTCTAPKKWVLLWNYIRTALLNGEKRKVMDFRHNAFQVLVDACTLIQLCIKKVECIFFLFPLILIINIYMVQRLKYFPIYNKNQIYRSLNLALMFTSNHYWYWDIPVLLWIHCTFPYCYIKSEHYFTCLSLCFKQIM